MEIKGRAHCFGDDVNTDYIISGKYKFKTLDMKELAKHVMEDLDPEFAQKVKPGDFVVAGKNFGCGSSREQAPLALLHAGVGAVLARSFARIFYRNAINTGLPVVECDTSEIDPGDELLLDLEKGILKNLTKQKEIPVKALPPFMLKILRDGGLVAHFRKYGTFKLD
ncbi:MAG: 3-isopropylmalate dehydratase small subunit [Thermoanaerobacterales bacterium 50_218]|nr:MAG: 3-isopropylmalate dehydratase small subunit [Thermoanaerobacterales bacterium 50_218]HAA90711.1 3-isopropylmalate dehydratase [Peptococcaceae bacterium]